MSGYYHSWGDGWPYWDDLHNAIDFFGTSMRFWRVPMRDYKEKFGQLRCYWSPGWTSCHDVTHPGHAYIRYKKGSLAYHLQYSKLVNRIFQVALYPLSRTFHIWAFRRCIRKTIAKWPHLRGELTLAVDFSELLEDLKPTKAERLARRTEYERTADVE